MKSGVDAKPLSTEFGLLKNHLGPINIFLIQDIALCILVFQPMRSWANTYAQNCIVGITYFKLRL